MSTKTINSYKSLPYIIAIIGLLITIFITWLIFHYYETKENIPLELVDENTYIIVLVPSIFIFLTLLLSFFINSLIKTKETAVQKLETSEERLRFSLEGTEDGLWDWDLKTDKVFFSKRWKEMLGFKENEIESNLEEWKNRVHPEDLEQVYKDIKNHIEGESNTYKNEHRVKCKDGSYKWVLDRGMIVSRDDKGNALRIVGSHSDISKRKEIQLKMEEYINIINKNVVSSSTDLNGNIIRVSEAFCLISGYTKDELIGYSHNIVKDDETPESVYQDLWNTITSGDIWEGEIKNKNKNGTSYWLNIKISPIKDDLGNITSYTAIHQDITDKKNIEKLSITDKLTQLFNRQKLDDIFSMKLATARRYNTSFSIIMLDIDHFKNVNDTWGHQAGDEILKEFAKILKNNIRETDVAGRWGGEEFLILSTDTDLTGAIELAQKLRKTISSFNFSFSERKTASFGVASYHIGDDEKAILIRADKALYRAKQKGRNKVEVEE